MLELCGGQLKEISTLEMMKRSDVMPSQTKDEGSTKGNDDDFNWNNEESV